MHRTRCWLLVSAADLFSLQQRQRISSYQMFEQEARQGGGFQYCSPTERVSLEERAETIHAQLGAQLQLEEEHVADCRDEW